MNHGSDKRTNYNFNLQAGLAAPEAGKPTKLIPVITEQSIGDPISEFEVVHDKLLRQQKKRN